MEFPAVRSPAVRLIYAVLCFFSTVHAQAGCHSYGVDFFDGGGPYFINTASPDDFSFITVFQGKDTTAIAMLK